MSSAIGTLPTVAPQTADANVSSAENTSDNKLSPIAQNDKFSSKGALLRFKFPLGSTKLKLTWPDEEWATIRANIQSQVNSARRGDCYSSSRGLCIHCNPIFTLRVADKTERQEVEDEEEEEYVDAKESFGATEEVEGRVEGANDAETEEDGAEPEGDDAEPGGDDAGTEEDDVEDVEAAMPGLIDSEESLDELLEAFERMKPILGLRIRGVYW